MPCVRSDTHLTGNKVLMQEDLSAARGTRRSDSSDLNGAPAILGSHMLHSSDADCHTQVTGARAQPIHLQAATAGLDTSLLWDVPPGTHPS